MTNLVVFACRNLARRPWRTSLAFVGLAAAIGTLAVLSALAAGYERELRKELDRSGVQLMLVPLGCPYDVAARVLKGRALDASLPAGALAQIRRDPAVAAAAPLLLCAQVRTNEDRADLWVGIDESVPALKPWWRVQRGKAWFSSTNGVILGSEAATLEMRAPGDRLYCPGADATFTVDGVLERSGTSDDSLFFVPLGLAQQLFGQPGRLTAIAIRLRDPALLAEAARRLQAIPGAQVVTTTEVMGVFQNLIGTVRALLSAVAIVAVTVGCLTVLNTLLAAVLERAAELALLRALGASRSQVVLALAIEALLLTSTAAAAGLLGAAFGGAWIQDAVRQWIPLAPERLATPLSLPLIGQCVLLGLGTGLVAVLYPALRALRMAPAQATRTA